MIRLARVERPATARQFYDALMAHPRLMESRNTTRDVTRVTFHTIDKPVANQYVMIHRDIAGKVLSASIAQYTIYKWRITWK